jgi:endonuclease/exonuclease/phosphatase family metal-dependent hydrolase
MRPHIVALQELNGKDSAEYLANSLGMAYYFAAARENGKIAFGNAILSAIPGNLIRAERLPHLRLRLETRCAEWVRFDTDWGPFDVINTHLGLSREERVLQVAELLGDNWLGNITLSRYVALCGDLNALPGSAVHLKLLGRLLDVQSRLRFRRATFPAFMPVARIDHVLIGSALAVERVIVPWDWLARTASDHRPLVVDLVPKEE